MLRRTDGKAGLGQTGEKRRCGHPGSAGKLCSLLFSPLDKKKKKKITEKGSCQWPELQTDPPVVYDAKYRKPGTQSRRVSRDMRRW